MGSRAHAPEGSAVARVVGSSSFLVAVLTLAAALRVGHVLALRPLPLFDTLIVDSALYDAWARRIAAGDWLGGQRAFYMDPLYPYMLAAIYRLAGHDLLVVRLFQAALGIGTCALVAVLGRRVAGRATGNFAALLLAVYGPAIFQEGEVEKTALGVFLVTAALALATLEPLIARLASGVFLALAVLTRGNLLLLVPFGALWFLLPGAGGVAPPASWRARIAGHPGRSAAAFLVGVLAVLTVVAVRNHHVSGEWILTASQGGQNFYTGNNPANRTGAYEYVPFVRPEPNFEENDFRAEAERRTGRAMDAREVSAFWYREALAHMAERPGFAATVFARKFTLFWSDFEMPDAWDMFLLARFSPVLRLPLLGMGLLLPFAALGAVVTWRGSREARLLAGYSLVYATSVVAFFVFSRYRLHVVPALAVFAAASLPWLGERMRRRQLRPLAVAGVALVAIATFSFHASSTFGIERRENPQGAINLAWLYRQRGEYAAAEKVLVEVLESQAGAARSGPLCALGDLFLDEDEVPRAVSMLEACALANPGYPEAWLRLGLAYERSGRFEDAIAALDVQLRAVPGHAVARAHLERLQRREAR